MPNPNFFAWGSAGSSLLALPRPSYCPSVGCYVALKGGNWAGPMAPCDYAIVLEDTGIGNTPYLVQELISGRLWCYPEAALQPVPEDNVPHELRHPPSPGEGSYVTLMPGFKSFSDAARGPLSLMRTEDAYGIVLMESGQRYRVRACHSRKDWWFDRGAVKPVHMKFVPEALRTTVRPAWGDYVALTSDHAAFGSAAEGPLEPGNLGVVVAVTEAADGEGGLGQARYTVRCCHNAQSYRYHEGALHLVVQQLLHAPKIPPSGGKGRRRKLQFTLQVTEAGSGNAVPVGQVLQQGQQQVRQVAVVTPGRKYWLAARLSCNDGDLMLANLKPCALNLYAPSGRPGSFLQLRPVPCTQQQPQQQGPQQLLSLAACNGAAAAGAAAAGSCAWYNPWEDDVLCVFEWDSAETPLALKQGRVTEVSFVWGVCFSDIEGIFTKQHTVPVQAAAAAATMQHGAMEAAGAAQQLHSADACNDSSTDGVVLDCWWLARSARSRHPVHNNGGSSSSNDSNSGEEDDEDAGADQAADSSSCEEDAGSNAEATEEEDSSDAEDNAGNGNPDAGADSHLGGGSSSGNAHGGGSSSRPGGGDCGVGFGRDGGAAGGNSSPDHGASHAPPTPTAGAMSAAALLALPPGAAGAAARHGAATSSSSSSSSSASRDQQGAASTSSAAEVQQSEVPESDVGSGSAAACSSRDAMHSCPRTPDMFSGRASSSSTGSSSRDCDCSSGRDQQQHTASAASSSSSRIAGASSISSSRRSTPAAPVSSISTYASRASASASASSSSRAASRRATCSAAVLSGRVNIQEIMAQVERQAESHQPLWQEGNELAQALAANAMEAAEQFLPDNWRHPCQGRAQQQLQQEL